MVFGDPFAVVLAAQFDVIAVATRANVDDPGLPGLIGMGQRVENQIADDLIDRARVGVGEQSRIGAILCT